MNTNSKLCPKCEGEMEQGFVPDYTHGGRLIGHWHAGRPKKSFWTGTKAPETQGIPLAAFRCRKCGLIEFYSDFQFGAE